MGIGTTDFPGALDSKDSLVWAANQASTTLATTINSTDTSIVLTSGAAFPSSGIVLIDSELIAYSSKATDTLTVQTSPTGRGYESTTAAGHTAGAVVRLVISAASHNVQSDAIIATQTKIGTGSSTPAANVVLTGTGTGTSAWATISNAFIASNAAIDLTKLATVTANRALVSSAGGVISASSVTATELGYVSGVTSAIQTQFSGKVSTGLITASGLTVNSLSRLLGRGTALGSDIQEISLDASLAFSGTILTAVPAGSTGQVQYNDSGFYGASPRFTFVTNGLSSDVLITTPEDTTNSRLILQRARSGPAAVTSGNVLGELLFQGYNASYLDGASIQATTTANWASSRSAKFLFSVRNGGTAFVYDLQFDRFLPPSDNSASLGISGTAWSTLHTRSITLAGSTSGTTVLQAAATAAGTYTWPGSDGTSGQVLSTNGSGVLSWASVTASAGGTNTQLQYNSSNSLAGITGATSDGTNVTFGSGNLIATSPSITTSLTTGSTSFDLINTTATTVNFAGAATTLNMAGGSGAVINLGGGANAAELRFLEPSGSGTNYTALKAQAQAANVTYTLPAADGTSGQVLSTNGSGTLSWATASGGGTPGGSGTELQFRGDASTFSAVTGSSVNGGAVTLADAMTVTKDDAGTNNTVTMLDIRRSSSGTPAANFGAQIRFGLETTTTLNRDAAAIRTRWASATDGSRRSEITLQTVNETFYGNTWLDSLIITSTTSGYVSGILGSQGRIQIIGNLASNGARFDVDTNYARVGASSSFDVYQNNAYGANPVLTVASSRVGINIGPQDTNPNASLRVGNTSASLVTFRADSAANPSADIVQFTNNGSNRWTLNSSATTTTKTIIAPNGATSATAVITESVTLSTSSTETNTTIQIPANAVVLAVSARITTTITGATAWQLGSGSIADRFLSSTSTLTAGTTAVGGNQWAADRTSSNQGPFIDTATAVKITTTGTPTAGVIRITIHYIQLTAATS